jgi:NAD(P)-dependent dehydrogenase (short-subunit alcohol dehydrogenase family)
VSYETLLVTRDNFATTVQFNRPDWLNAINRALIISDAGRVGEPRLVAYSAGKGSVIAFAKALAKEVGRFSVTVNCVSPATTATEATEKWIQEHIDQLVRQYPMGRGLNRLGRPDDIANAVAFLASERAEWITGQVMSVNGGYSMAD